MNIIAIPDVISGLTSFPFHQWKLKKLVKLILECKTCIWVQKKYIKKLGYKTIFVD